MRHRADIEGLRAVAVLPVVFFHLGIGVFSGGYVGVDIFFVISGFLITNVITEDIRRGRFTIANFYNRRIKRIFPALYFMIFVCLLFSIVLLPQDLAAFSTSIVSVALFSSNVFFWITTNYFDAPAQSKPLLHTWSLSVEEQFYVLYPLLLFALGRQYNRIVLGVIAGLGLVSLGLCVGLTPSHPSAAFYLPFTRAWELLAGAFVARAVWPAAPGLREAGALAGIAAILVAIFGFQADTPFPGYAALLPVAGAALLIAAGPATWVAKALSIAPAGFVGRLSYSLYLWHWPIIVFVRYYYLTLPLPAVAAICLVLSFVLSYFSLLVVERPFRTRPFPVRAVLLAGVAVSVLFIGVGAVGRFEKGFPGRFPSAVAMTDPPSYHRGTCFLEDTQSFSAWSPEHCTFAASVEPARRIVIWGDSYAAHLTPGFLALQKETPLTLTEVTMTGCPPVLDYDEPGRVNCRPFMAAAESWIDADAPDLVVIAARWNRYRDFSLVAGKLAATLARMKAQGIKFLLVGESPTYTDPVPQILTVLQRRGIPADVFTPENTFATDTVLRRMAEADDGLFFAPRTALCDGQRCRIKLDGQALHWDQGHLSDLGSTRVVAAMRPLLGIGDLP